MKPERSKLRSATFTKFEKLLLIVAFLFLFVSCSHLTNSVTTPPSIKPDEIRRAYYQYRQELLTNWQDWVNKPEKEPRLKETLGRIWSIIGEWTVAYLQSHPDNVSPDEITQNIELLDPTRNCGETDYKCFEEYHLTATVVKLKEGDDASYAVSVNYPRMGTFFVVSRRGGRNYHVAWNIYEIAKIHYPLKDELGYWAYLCFPGYGDGPLVGHVRLLPPNKDGAPRFYVDAIASAEAGGTLPKQISIWEWNGNEAIPLLIETYLASFDTGIIKLEGDLLRIPIKENYRTFFSCGMCKEAAVIWTIRISPTGVEDLGRKHVVPELLMVDELWHRLTNGLDAHQFASQQVILEMRRLIQKIKADATTPDEYKSLSMLGDWKLIKKGNKQLLCFGADNLYCNLLLFEIKQRQEGLFLSSLRVIDDCQTSCSNMK